MNILFTAGTQFPFPRMARVVEQVARCRPEWHLVFQAGPGAFGSAMPACATAHGKVQAAPMFSQETFEILFQESDLVVTHAGMGNLLLCLEWAKPFFMLPRLARLDEHRNDHQRDTAVAISARYDIPSFYELEPLVNEIIGLRPGTLNTLEVGSSIAHERREFASRLNFLVKSL